MGIVLVASLAARAGDDDDVDLAAYQFSRQLGEPIRLPFRINALYVDILSRGVTELAQPLVECVELRVRRRGTGQQHADAGRLSRLLRAGGERPRYGRGTEQGRKIAPPHSMTSSATASSVGGMIRPSALAAFRLITNVNLVAW